MRRVKGRAYRDSEWLEFNCAYFHQWGTETCEEGEYTVAIIELEDGSVCTTRPEWITFVNK